MNHYYIYQFEIFYSFWQQLQSYNERVEFVENFSKWSNNEIVPSPATLGYVVLSPSIQLTPAGVELVSSRRKEEIFLRQLLKFQIPSPYHKPTENSAEFWVKPYL